MEDFDKEAVEELADRMEEKTIKNGGEMTQREALSLFKDIEEVGNLYSIPREKRIDFAEAGMERVIDRQKEKALAEFRESVESVLGKDI